MRQRSAIFRQLPQVGRVPGHINRDAISSRNDIGEGWRRGAERIEDAAAILAARVDPDPDGFEICDIEVLNAATDIHYSRGDA